MTAQMLTIGFLSLAPPSNSGVKWGQSMLLLTWYPVYCLTIGAVGYTLVGEVSSTRLRTKTVCLARNAYNLANILSSVVGPYLLNPSQANLKGKAAFLAGGISVLVTIWAYFRVPETQGRTYEELDILFQRRIKAKDFKKTIIDADAPSDEMAIVSATHGK